MPKPYHSTDLGNAERLAHRHGDKLRFVPEWGWLVYNGKVWERSEGGAFRLAKETVKSIYGEAANISDVKERQAAARWASRSEAANRLQAMIALCKSEPAIEAKPDDFDGNHFLFNCANGAIDLAAGKLRPHSSKDHITRISDVEFDPQARCPTWLRFLDQAMGGDSDQVAYLQRAVGYSLTGSTKERCFFFLHGPSGTGKTTFIETVLSLIGDYGQKANFNSFIRRHNETARNDLAAMNGARLVAATEAGQGKKFDERLIKEITGGDTIRARFLYHEDFQFRPEFKLFLASNHKPIVDESGNAIWQRLKVVEFGAAVPPDKQDRDLPQRLRAELPGILNWALQGCRDWQKHGLCDTLKVKAAVSAYESEMDTLGTFIQDCCTAFTGALVKSQELFDTYKLWCVDVGEDFITQKTFTTRLEERGFARKRSKRGMIWNGIALKP